MKHGILTTAFTAILIGKVALALPPFDPNEPRPYRDDGPKCVFDNVECVREFHVFTNVRDVLVHCVKGPCKVFYVKTSFPQASYSEYLRDNDTLYLYDLELFVWYGKGYGSATMTDHGAYIILNREVDPIVPRCQY